MRRIAISYGRVSTKDQADNGTSLGDQKKVTRKKCDDEGMEFLRHYEDDCSGKSFDNRPGFNTLLSDIKSKRIKPNVLIVARMDRFSRDLHSNLNMLEELKQHGVELMTCDINHDISIPENFIPFVLQMAIPQVENDRRGLNTRNGMRQKIREGKYMGKAPRGYDNVRIGNEKWIAPNETAPLIRMAFEEVAKQIYPINEIRRRMRKKGLKVSQPYFYVLLKNIVYKGKLLLKAYRDEPEEIFNGLHEPIIDERLFNKVQDIMNGKNKTHVRSSKHDDNLPLRKQLICTECGTPVTGSRSKGGSAIYYYYYHCQKGCKRYRASQMHDDFNQLLASFEISEEYLTLYKEILLDVISGNQKTKEQGIKSLDKQIQQYQDNLDEAVVRYSEKKLSDSAYNRIVKQYENMIDELMSQQADISYSDCPIEDYVQSGMTILSDLPRYYTNADMETKSMIVSSIFPEKLIYDGEIYRTPKLNAFVSQITSDIKLYKEVKKEKAHFSANLSFKVTPTRIELVSKV